MNVATGRFVTIQFELKVKGGAVIESSEKSGPLRYEHGAGKMLAGFEKRIEGLTVGEERRGEIPAGEAFGNEASLPTKDIPRSEFPAGEKLEAGRVFEAKGPTGEPISFQVVGEQGENVTVRFLHPLAGKDLEYSVKVLLIDDPIEKKRVAFVPPPPAAAFGVRSDELKES